MDGAAHGRSGDAKDNVARFLGWFSLALGAAQLAAPGAVTRAIGLGEGSRRRALMRLVGARELAAGVGILARPRPAGWLLARVAGDAMDLALLGVGMNAPGAKRGRVAVATAAVAGVTVPDVVESLRLRNGPAAGSRDAAAHIAHAITVNRPPEEVYWFWRDLQNLPKFMAHLESVEVTGEQRSRWRAKGPAGRTVEWDAEIIEERPDELIAWRSLEGADVQNSGSVRFASAPGGRGTEVRLELRYSPPGGPLGASIAKLFGEEPELQTYDDLRRFKQVIETGEVVRSEGSPDGLRFLRQLKQRPAQPAPAGERGSVPS